LNIGVRVRTRRGDGRRATRPSSRLWKGSRREEKTRTSLVRMGGRSPFRLRCFIAPLEPPARLQPARSLATDLMAL
jgi:hypothetical protein